MIRATDLTDPKESIFTHVLPGGENINIAASRLRNWCLEHKPETTLIPIDPQAAATWINTNVVSFMRVMQLTDLPQILLEPVILCKDGHYTNGRPDAFFVDGHHRYCALMMIGLEAAPSWVLEQNQWRRFMIHGLPDMTHSELLAIPTLQLHHFEESK